MVDKKYISDAVSELFADHGSALANVQKKLNQSKTIAKTELELALAVLLVDLASCDQRFDPEEYNIIQNALMSLFGTTKHQIQQLVNQANLMIANLRGTSKFAELLRNHLSDQEKHFIMKTVEALIQADGKEDSFETYFREKIKSLLAI